MDATASTHIKGLPGSQECGVVDPTYRCSQAGLRGVLIGKSIRYLQEF